MKKVRQQVFETNSSSSHSLTVASTGKILDTLGQDGIITLNSQEFGWGVEEYDDAQTKAEYVALLLLYVEQTITRKSIESYKKQTLNWDGKPLQDWEYGYVNLSWWCDQNFKQCYTNFYEVLTEQTGCQINFQANLDDGYIDHQSIESIDDFEILLDKEMLRQFIFNPNSTLEISNDNQ